MFGIILTTLVTLMQLYVFGRAAFTPSVTQWISRRNLLLLGLILWILFAAARVFRHHETTSWGQMLQFFGMNWMAILFLMFASLCVADIVTLFGLVMPRLASQIRGLALVVGVTLGIIALFQGLRPPVVENYAVALSGLPDELDGTVLIALSDTHLGSQLGARWLAARIEQVQAEQPDMVLLLGDIFEGHGAREDQLVQTFKQLTAPMGVWAVLGNHEFHGGGSDHLFEQSGIRLLRNQWAQVRPGLILAGVDDLTSARRRGQGGDPVARALSNRPQGAAILLSHTPWRTADAARAGAGLMLCGHTHGGQIWPFDYLVQRRYPLLEGLYHVDHMPVIVSRGAGVWGPRMRLWNPGEIVRVTLLKGPEKSVAEASAAKE